MPGAPIHTWRDLLLPNRQDTHIIHPRVIEGRRQDFEASKTSSFSLLAWDPGRLPSAAHLFEDLPSRMREHLGAIIDQHYPTEAARTIFRVTNECGYSVTPDWILRGMKGRCTSRTLNLSREAATTSITGSFTYEVGVMYEALAGNFLDVQRQEHTSNSSVITDHGFRIDDGIKVLWADKSSRAFDRFIGELMEQMRDRSTVELCTKPVPTTYRGYKAILAKVCVCLCQTSPI
jgi:hypothetical protein